jgi:hypothetical protein
MQQHDEELNTFENHWNDPEFLKKFAKPWLHRFEVQRIQRSMGLAKMLVAVP